VTIGSDVYEFAADAAQSVTGAIIAVNITNYTTASQGTLTITNQVTSADTMLIGSKTYTFVPNGTATADGEVSIGTSLLTCQSNIVKAINGTDSINTANTVASAGAFNATSNSVITALIGGTAGDTIATTNTFTDAGNVFDAATLGTTTPGVDCVASNAVTAIVAASSGGTEAVTLADGAGDTVTVTANTAGTAGNAIATTETMANGAFGAATLASGVDGTIASAGQMYYDSSYLYITISDNTVSGSNWRRISLGSAY
jgi:hypothetical protein